MEEGASLQTIHIITFRARIKGVRESRQSGLQVIQQSMNESPLKP